MRKTPGSITSSSASRVLRDGVKVGVVSLVDHLPAQDLLHVTTDAGEVLVPFVKAIVPAVDIAAGTLTVTPPTGLFEELPDEPDDELDDEPITAAEPVEAPTEASDEPAHTPPQPA